MSSEYYNYNDFSYLDHCEPGYRAVLNLVFEFIRPQSLLDVGCSVGGWLKVAKSLGVEDILGLDVQWYLDSKQLVIPPENFRAVDLRYPAPLERTFDLAMCLEMAEHIPQNCSDALVDLLTQAAPIVLFSAALPGQGGRGHINEQWPEYWQEKFKRRGFLIVDCLRTRLWKDESIPYFYRQNIFLYVNSQVLDSNEMLRAARQSTNEEQLALVHPELLKNTIQALQIENLSVRHVLSSLPGLIAAAVKRRLTGLP